MIITSICLLKLITPAKQWWTTQQMLMLLWILLHRPFGCRRVTPNRLCVTCSKSSQVMTSLVLMRSGVRPSMCCKLYMGVIAANVMLSYLERSPAACVGHKFFPVSNMVTTNSCLLPVIGKGLKISLLCSRKIEYTNALSSFILIIQIYNLN